MAWRDSEPRWLLTNYLELGVAPSLVAFWLAKRAWATRPLPSAGLCALGLVVLLVAMTLWRAFVVSF
jgi:hypothetical protein